MRFALLLATSCVLSACAARNGPVLAGSENVFEDARSGNWRVRAFTGTAVHEGRVSFVRGDRMRIYNTEVMIADIDSLHRSVEIDRGGKVAGAFLGGVVGAVVGYMALGFCGYGGGRCNTLTIMLPTIGTAAILGTLIGTAVDPPQRRWRTVWKRP